MKKILCMVGSFMVAGMVCAEVINSHGAPPVISVGPGGTPGYEALTGASLQSAINTLAGAMGGTILVKPGVYAVSKVIRFKPFSAQPIEIVGEPGSKLVLDLAPLTTTTQTISEGEMTVRVEKTDGFRAGTTMEFAMLDGIKHQYVIRSLTSSTLTLKTALTAASIPAGTPIIQTENMFLLEKGIQNVTFRNLEMDLQKDAQPYMPVNHTRQCAIHITGTYTHGGTPPVAPANYCRNIRVLDCRISNTPRRPITLYATQDCEVSGCTIRNSRDEAINIDHYSERAKVTNNDIMNTGGEYTGIEINDGVDCLISSNSIQGYSVGIKIWHYLPATTMVRPNMGNLVKDNLIRNCGKKGIWLAKNVNENTICSNTVDTIKRPAGWAIEVQGNDNHVYGNVILNAAQEVLLSGSNNSTTVVP